MKDALSVTRCCCDATTFVMPTVLGYRWQYWRDWTVGDPFAWTDFGNVSQYLGTASVTTTPMTTSHTGAMTVYWQVDLSGNEVPPGSTIIFADLVGNSITGKARLIKYGGAYDPNWDVRIYGDALPQTSTPDTPPLPTPGNRTAAVVTWDEGDLPAEAFSFPGADWDAVPTPNLASVFQEIIDDASYTGAEYLDIYADVLDTMPYDINGSPPSPNPYASWIQFPQSWNCRITYI